MTSRWSGRRTSTGSSGTATSETPTAAGAPSPRRGRRGPGRGGAARAAGSVRRLTHPRARNHASACPIALAATDSLVLPNLVVAEGGRSATVREEWIREPSYGDCSDEDVAHTGSSLVPRTAPFGTPVRTTESGFGRVPRVYVEGLRARAIPIELQRQTHAPLPCGRGLSPDTDHSPSFSAPDELIARLTAKRRWAPQAPPSHAYPAPRPTAGC